MEAPAGSTTRPVRAGPVIIKAVVRTKTLYLAQADGRIGIVTMGDDPKVWCASLRRVATTDPTWGWDLYDDDLLYQLSNTDAPLPAPLMRIPLKDLPLWTGVRDFPTQRRQFANSSTETPGFRYRIDNVMSPYIRLPDQHYNKVKTNRATAPHSAIYSDDGLPCLAILHKSRLYLWQLMHDQQSKEKNEWVAKAEYELPYEGRFDLCRIGKDLVVVTASGDRYILSDGQLKPLSAIATVEKKSPATQPLIRGNAILFIVDYDSAKVETVDVLFQNGQLKALNPPPGLSKLVEASEWAYTAIQAHRAAEAVWRR